MDVRVNQKTRNLVILGVLLAIGIILDVTPLGAIPIGGVSATITMLPVILGGILLGPVYGAALGTAMGVVSLLHALMRPATILDPLFVNPLLSVLPRTFIGVVSFWAYQLIKKLFHKQTPALIIGGIAGSLTNTVLVLSMLYFLYGNELLNSPAFQALQLANRQALIYLLLGVVASNGAMEALLAAVITCGIGLGLKKGLPADSTRL